MLFKTTQRNRHLIRAQFDICEFAFNDKTLIKIVEHYLQKNFLFNSVTFPVSLTSLYFNLK